jgi:hypothetical protein
MGGTNVKGRANIQYVRKVYIARYFQASLHHLQAEKRE